MHDPDFLCQLHRVNHAERIAFERQRDLKYAGPLPFIGFAISALLPSAAIVKAARQMDRAPSGNSSNSLSAAFTHDAGRVLRASAIRLGTTHIIHVVISDNWDRPSMELLVSVLMVANKMPAARVSAC